MTSPAPRQSPSTAPSEDADPPPTAPDGAGVDLGPAARAEVEQAKGLLMGLLAVDAEGAAALLRSWSTTHDLSVRDVSAAVVFVALDTETPEDHSRALLEIVTRLRRPPGAV